MSSARRHLSSQLPPGMEALRVQHPLWRYSGWPPRQSCLLLTLVRASASGESAPARHCCIPAALHCMHVDLTAWCQALHCGSHLSAVLAEMCRGIHKPICASSSLPAAFKGPRAAESAPAVAVKGALGLAQGQEEVKVLGLQLSSSSWGPSGSLPGCPSGRSSVQRPC